MELYTGDMIRKLRMLKEEKQAAVAKKMGISQQAYSLLENSKEISLPVLLKVIKALNSNIAELNNVKTLIGKKH